MNAAVPPGPRTPNVGSPRDVRRLPKAHLHLHFTGSMRHQTLLDLATKNDISLPGWLRRHELPELAPTQRGWFRFQRLYDAARAVVRDESDMRRIIHEAAEDDAAEGSGWLEIQVDPSSYAPLVGGLTQAIEIVLSAANEASQATSCSVAVIIAASRIRHPLDARTLARLAARYAGGEAATVVGFGLSNDERRGSTPDFGPAFGIAKRAGLAAMPHSGELLGPDHIRQTLQALEPTRLGHGVRCAEDAELLQYVVDAGVALEVCPGSNVSLGVYSQWSDVPVRALFDAGARIALSADDPLLFGSRLTEQYESARNDHDFSDMELAALARMSIEASFAPPLVRESLLTGVDAWLSDETHISSECSSGSGVGPVRQYDPESKTKSPMSP